MRLFISKFSSFIYWWTTTLLSCLPTNLVNYFGKLNRKFDLVIAHQGQTIFIQSERGKIIDSVSLSSEDTAQKLNINDDETVLFAESLNAQKDSTPIDINLSVTSLDQDEESDKQENTSNTHSWKEYLEDQTNVTNIKPLYISEGDETTRVFDTDDKTTQFLALNLEGDEDTVIIKNDQGQLLNIRGEELEAKDNTLIFRNEDGKIKLVTPASINTDAEAEAIYEPSAVENEVQDEADEKQDFEVVGRLLAMYQGNKKCLYLLPDEKVFKVNLNYPIEAIQNIEKVLRYDLEKHIPLSFHEVRYFYALNVNAAKNQVDVEIAVIKSIEFDLMNNLLEPYIEKGLVCTTQNFFEKFGRKINFVEKKSEKTLLSFVKASNIHFAFNTVLMLVLLVIPYFLYHQYSDTLKVDSPEDLTKVQNIITSMNLINTETKFGSRLSQKVRDIPRLINILSIMSENISQQAWLSRYSFKNNELRIKGEAVSATAVSDELSSTGLFESIKFVSSIIKNPRNDKETFELLLRLKSGV